MGFTVELHIRSRIAVLELFACFYRKPHLQPQNSSKSKNLAVGCVLSDKHNFPCISLSECHSKNLNMEMKLVSDSQKKQFNLHFRTIGNSRKSLTHHHSFIF